MTWISCARGAAIAVASLVLLATGMASAEQRAAELHDAVVVPGDIAAELDPVAMGLVQWLGDRLVGAGATVRQDPALRAETAALGRQPATPALLELASRAGARRALVVDLSSGRGAIEVVLRVHEPDSGELLALGRAFATLENLSPAADDALAGILSRLGASASNMLPAAPISSEEMAARSRAIAHLDRGELADAWRALGDHDERSVGELRAAVETAAAQPTAPHFERARLLALRGRGESAWQLVRASAAAQLHEARPDPRLLVAAGESQLARQALPEARAFFERALETDPANSAASLGLAHTMIEAGDAAGAAMPLARAAALDPDDPEALERLAQLPGQTPTDQARAWIGAGERRARRLDTDDAQLHFERAIAVEPGLEADAREGAARVHARLGNAQAALTGFQQAIHAGGTTSARKLGVARAQRALHHPETAEASYREAIALAPDAAIALRELGELYTETGRAAEGRQHLERAIALTPRDPAPRRALARSLATSGENARALELLQGAAALGPAGASDFQTMAGVQRALGDVSGAQATLEQGVMLAPAAVELRRELAQVYDENGDAHALQEARRMVAILDTAGAAAAEHAPQAPALASNVGAAMRALVSSFGPPQHLDPGEAPQVALIGLRKEHDWGRWRTWLPDWLAPRVLDLDHLQRDLASAITAHYSLDETRRPSEYNAAAVDRLFQFGSNASLDAQAIAGVNLDMMSDASFLAQVSQAPPNPQGPCGAGDGTLIQLRRLDGDALDTANLLGNTTCLPDPLATHGRWNPRAAAAYGLALLLVGLLFYRGWGRVVVTAQVPPNTVALFSVSLSRRPRRVKRHTELASGKATGRFQRRLREHSPFERKLEPGVENVFRWIPARKRPLYITVRGPLMDSFSKELIGDFLEEKTITVSRGETVRVEFDMRPKEAAIRVSVVRNSQPVEQAMVSVRGLPSSLRYAREGDTFLYLEPGSYVVMGGAVDRVAERPLRIDDCQAVALIIDLGQDEGLLFKDCPDAVAPCLESNFAVAADALEAAGQPQVAHLLRATGHRERGELEAAGRALEAAGQDEAAAQLRATHSAEPERSATYFEEAGDHASAAHAYREQGDLASAARAYEEAYDWANAIDCYERLGDDASLLGVLEKSGDVFEAGRLSAESAQWERAIQNLQQVDSRHDRYSEACRMLAQILVDRGEVDFAIEKYDEARRVGGIENFPIEVQDRYAKLLEESGRGQDALSVYAVIRRQDLNYGNVSTRIESLKKQMSRLEGQAPAAAPEDAAAAPRADSRYEILGELGRGGMGVVYKARDRHLGRIVALKQLPDNLRSHPTAVRFFEREARAAAALNHPNIVTIYDAGQEEGNYFISMEFLEGTPLDVVLRKRGSLSPGIVARIGAQVATGLHYAHERRIIHRDIKTANLFLTRDRVVKIMDFGLAKMLEEVRRASTVIGGTPYYMPPEQAKGGAVDHRADLYALGVTLFQLATGRVPFEDGDVSYHHAHTPAPDARELDATVPAEMAALFLRLMAKSPDERCQSAAEVVQQLSRIAKALSQAKGD